MNRSLLSAGFLIKDFLAEPLSGKVTKLYPVATDKAVLPYVTYERVSAQNTPTKTGSADKAIVLICVYTKTYREGVDLAEIVRDTLHLKQGESQGLRMRRCYMVDASEGWEADAFVQRLEFELNID